MKLSMPVLLAALLTVASACSQPGGVVGGAFSRDPLPRFASGIHLLRPYGAFPSLATWNVAQRPE